MTLETSSGAVEDFAWHLLAICNSGMLALMIGVGHRTRLFDVMASLLYGASCLQARAFPASRFVGLDFSVDMAASSTLAVEAEASGAARLSRGRWSCGKAHQYSSSS